MMYQQNYFMNKGSNIYNYVLFQWNGKYTVCISIIQMFLTTYSFYDVYIIVNTFITRKSFNEFYEILINIAYDLCAF